MGVRRGMAENGEQQSSLKQFLASIATIKGDLSNITAPPFVLADKSTTEFPRYWIEHPDLFVAPAQEGDPAKRILAVLKWFLASLKAQQYAGREPKDGVKKPLNAFLGELYLGEIDREGDATKIVSEQVSHHPPVTACYLWNDKHGVRAEGYTRQEITFTGSVNIRQIGHAILHVDKYDEDYLIPLPNVKVTGILSGSPYPELHGHYTIASSSGCTAVIDFSGKGFFGFGGEKNHVVAAVFDGDNKDKPLYTVDGCWTESFSFKDGDGKEFDSYNVNTAPRTDCTTPPTEDQDPWESHRAWKDVIDAIHAGNMRAVSDSKSKLENAQREMRKQAGLSEDEWKPIFFKRHEEHPIAQKLHRSIDQELDVDGTRGIWRFNHDEAVNLRRPWRGELTPSG